MNELARRFTFAETGELLGHLLDGHIIHLPSKPLSQNTGRDRVEKDHLEFLPDSGTHPDSLQSLDICR